MKGKGNRVPAGESPRWRVKRAENALEIVSERTGRVRRFEVIGTELVETMVDKARERAQGLYAVKSDGVASFIIAGPPIGAHSLWWRLIGPGGFDPRSLYVTELYNPPEAPPEPVVRTGKRASTVR